MATNPLDIALIVAEAFERLGVRYLISGSLASAIHGETRTTQDADLVAEMKPEDVAPFASALEDRFDVDVEMIRWAIRDKKSFNIFHRAEVFKVDVFIPTSDSLDRSQMARRRREKILVEPDRWAYLATPEDTVLQKLRWYRIGGGTSETQWRDVLGILKLRAEPFDLEYLRHTAAAVQLSDLLEKAFRESGLKGT